MTSISSLTGTNSTSSIYGNRNVISGLASGMDTETLIENAVSGFKSKITGLQQKQEMVQWKQEAYRSIIDKMVSLTRKYTSYTSSTNLFSNTFFNKAVKTVANGKNADFIAASGKTSSNVQIDGVKQLAQAAKLNLGVGKTALANAAATQNDAGRMVATGGAIDLTQDVKVSNIAGGMTMMYGGSAVYLNFEELDTYTSADELAKGIEKKLGESQVKTGSGDYVKASDRIGVKVDGSKISFYDKAGAGNSVYISSATEEQQKILGFTASREAPTGEFSMTVNYDSNLYSNQTAAEYLSGKEINVTLDGVSKTIKLGDFKGKEDFSVNDIASSIQNSLKDAFGAGKIAVNATDGKLSFDIAPGSTLSVTSSAGKALGLGDEGLTSYLNTNKKLGDLLGEDFFAKNEKTTQEAEINLSDMIKLSGSSINIKVGDETKTINLGEVGYNVKAEDMADRLNAALKNAGINDITVETNGASKLNFVSQNANNKFEITSGNKDKSDLFATSKATLDLTVNGKTIGKFNEDSTLGSVINAVNNADTGINISYSKLTNEFSMAAKDTGEVGKIEIGGGLSELFGFGGENGIKVNDNGELVNQDGSALNSADYTYTKGQDAIFTATVNGKQMELTRSSNTVDMDGMSVTLKGTFGEYENVDGKDKLVAGSAEAVTFTTSSDSDTIVDAIKSFVEDYNAMVKEIHEAYSTLPNEKSSKNHSRYMPLTDEDREGMSETAIANYEAKAKQGILFGANDLSNLYRQLTNTIQMTGADNAAFKAMGITTSYSNGVTTLELDENALREALDSDPDKVRDAFTKTMENGASSNGLMYNLKNVMDVYANTSSGSMGLLIQQAGSSYSPGSVNSNFLQKEYDEYTKQIEKWQTKMSDRVDYYTKQFTALEQLVAQMNNQSSMLSGLMGGY